jgi:deoxyadenosine/deoxycytidine kinase
MDLGNASDAALPESSSSSSASANSFSAFSPSLHVTVIGNIGVGKTRFIATFNELWQEKNSKYELKIYPEPVEVWRSFGSKNFNYLGNMYNDPSKFAFEFQAMAAISKAKQLGELQGVCLVERTFDCQRNVFIPILRANGHLTDTQTELLNDLLDVCDRKEPDLIIWITCDEETIEDRIGERGREEERGVSREYIREIEKRYTEWIENLNLKRQSLGKRGINIVPLDTTEGHFTKKDLELIYLLITREVDWIESRQKFT